MSIRSSGPLRSGCYDDAQNFEALLDRVLMPLGSAGPHVYAAKVYDMATDQS